MQIICTSLVSTFLHILALFLLVQIVNLEEVKAPVTNTTTEHIVDDNEELLPDPEPLIGQYPHDFFLSSGFSSRSYSVPGSSDHDFAEQELARGERFGGDNTLAHRAAHRAQAAEQAQHGAAAKAALVAAFRLAEEAKAAAKEAESVAAAKQYHAAHLSSAAQGAQGRAFAEAAFSAKVSKVLHAAEAQEKQSKQQAEVLKSAAYAAQSLTDQARYVTEALRHLFSAQKAAAIESRDTAKKLSLQQQAALEKLSQAQAAANKAHAAAAAALANVHKNGIYGGGDASLFGGTSDEEYEAKISFHTDHHQDGPSQDQSYSPEIVTPHHGPQYDGHPGLGGPQYDDHPDHNAHHPVGELAFQPPHYEDTPSPVTYQSLPEYIPQSGHTNTQTQSLEGTSSHFSPSQHIEINDAAGDRVGDHHQPQHYGVGYVQEGELMYDQGAQPVIDWSLAQGGDNSFAFTNKKETFPSGEFYEKDGKIVYLRQVDYGNNELENMPLFDGQNKKSASKDGLEGVSMSEMRNPPYIVNGGGSDLIFRKTGVSSSHQLQASKYSPVPEGSSQSGELTILGRSGSVSLGGEAGKSERDSRSESEETTSESAESSTRGARGGRRGGGRRKLKVYKEKVNPPAALTDKQANNADKSGEKKVENVEEVLEPAVNT